MRVDLIRPASWVNGLDAQEGKQIWLELEELNGRGGGRAMKLSRARPVKQGEGRVVTGVFSHEVSGLINVHVEGLDKPIGVTDNHPFWSEDRQESVQAGSLKQGERLRAMVGRTVYNLEVEGEHAYQVTGLGLVVHNSTNYTGKTFGLGLDKDLDNFRRTGIIMYLQGGWQRAGLTRIDWGRAVSSITDFEASFRQAAKNTEYIVFDVSSYSSKYTKKGVTEWELKMIQGNKELLNKGLL